MEKDTKAVTDRIRTVMKRMTGDAYLAIGIMGAALFFGFYSFMYPSLKSKLLPLVVSGFIFVLAGIQLMKEISQNEQANKIGSKAEHIDEEWEDSATDSAEWWRKNIIVFSWLLGFFLLIYVLGFIISILIFVFAFLKFNRRGWPTSIITALMSTALIYVVFVVVLKADLFPGIITEALLRHFG